MLNYARLFYGMQSYDVEPNQTLPIPKEFDFDNAEQCAREIAAMMSNASGGFAVKDVKVSFSKKFNTANVSGSGVGVYYKGRKIEVTDLDEYLNDRVVIELGTVSTDQYGDGWKRAVWI